jgi:hypothetical protein
MLISNLVRQVTEGVAGIPKKRKHELIDESNQEPGYP